MPNHTISDVSLVLERICGLAERSNVIYRRQRVWSRMSSSNTPGLLSSEITSFTCASPQSQPQEESSRTSFTPDRIMLGMDGDLTESTGHEHKISSYLLKSLDAPQTNGRTVKTKDSPQPNASGRAWTSRYSRCTSNPCFK